MMHRPLTYVIAAILLCVAPFASPARAAPLRDDPKATETQMEAWWADLEKGDFEASRALLKLSSCPRESVPFLKRKLPPLTIDAARVKALIADLGDPKEAVWKSAVEQLQYFDPRLAIDLETLMKDVTDSPNRQRMVAVLAGAQDPAFWDGKRIELRANGREGFGFVFADGSSGRAEHRVDRISASYWENHKRKWTRAVRAIALLEHIGSPEAIAILKDLTTGHPEARPTVAAVAALQRIGGKSK
jgi:hypothetical protein